MYGKMKMADGGMTPVKTKRPNPYNGNEEDMKEMEKETSTQNFAKGGMAGKKGAVMAIVAKLAKKPSKMGEALSEGEGEEENGMEMEEEGMGASKEAKMAAAEEVMSALKSNNKEMFAGALENFMRACSYED